MGCCSMYAFQMPETETEECIWYWEPGQSRGPLCWACDAIKDRRTNAMPRSNQNQQRRGHCRRVSSVGVESSRCGKALMDCTTGHRVSGCEGGRGKGGRMEEEFAK